ncbi:hypothetical protein [Lysobacter brunescens]
MPLAPHLTTVRDRTAGVDVPQFLLLGFRGDAGNGGFLNFDVNVGASQSQIDRLAQAIANDENLRNAPRLAPVPLEDGTVRLLMLGKASDSTAAPTGTQDFVLKIDHHAKPALYGNNQAAFSVRLDQDGFSLMRSCLDGEILPVAVIYSLDFLGLRPAYNIRLKVDWDRVQKHMDESFSVGFIFGSSEIGKAVDELVDSRAIVLESDTFVVESDDTKGIIDRRDAALAQVRAMITEAFFNVSLPPWTPEKKPDWERAMDAVGRFAGQQAAHAAGGPAMGLMPSFSYKRMDYTRMDRKSLNVNFSERVAVKKSIHPQGHLAALTKTLRDGGLPLDRFVKQVSLDNDWFQKRRIKGVVRADMAADDIASINLRARYAGKPKNALLTPAAPEASFEWLSELRNGAMVREVEVDYEVTFKSVDTAERPAVLKSKPRMVDVDNLEIMPRELYAIATVPVLAENFPWDRYTSVEVHLRYTDERQRHRAARHVPADRRGDFGQLEDVHARSRAHGIRGAQGIPRQGQPRRGTRLDALRRHPGGGAQSVPDAARGPGGAERELERGVRSLRRLPLRRPGERPARGGIAQLQRGRVVEGVRGRPARPFAQVGVLPGGPALQGRALRRAARVDDQRQPHRAARRREGPPHRHRAPARRLRTQEAPQVHDAPALRGLRGGPRVRGRVRLRERQQPGRVRVRLRRSGAHALRVQGLVPVRERPVEERQLDRDRSDRPGREDSMRRTSCCSSIRAR